MLLLLLMMLMLLLLLLLLLGLLLLLQQRSGQLRIILQGTEIQASEHGGVDAAHDRVGAIHASTGGLWLLLAEHAGKVVAKHVGIHDAPNSGDVESARAR